MAQQAQDTFTAELKDGSSVRVVKGEVFPDNHEVVLKDEGRGLLFKPLDFGEETPPLPAKSVAKGAAGRPAGKAAS